MDLAEVILKEAEAKGYIGVGPKMADSFAAAVRSFMGDAVLPCDVTVEPLTTFKRGVRISTLLECIEDRRIALNETEGWPCLRP